VSPAESPFDGGAGYWDSRYEQGDHRWDLGGPTPVLVRLLEEGTLRPCTILVPGCGSGYDAIVLAQRGFDVVAVDYSVEAIRRASEAARRAGAVIRFLQRDIFTLSPEFDGAFGGIFEYVTYCAVDPARRGALAELYGSLLAPGGTLAALFFPVEEREGGPPFAVSLGEVHSLFGRWFTSVSWAEHPATIPPRKGREILTVWQRNQQAENGEVR
jgi:SAM-dependent methyltransferase